MKKLLGLVTLAAIVLILLNSPRVSAKACHNPKKCGPTPTITQTPTQTPTPFPSATPTPIGTSSARLN